MEHIKFIEGASRVPLKYSPFYNMIVYMIRLNDRLQVDGVTRLGG